MRTVLSVEQVARMGTVGCGAVSQARVVAGEEGERAVRRVRWAGRGCVVVGIFAKEETVYRLGEKYYDVLGEQGGTSLVDS